MAKGYDWATIKAEYETGKYSMRELSDKHGFNIKYALRKANNNGWNKGESRKEVEKEAANKVLEYMATSEAELRNEFAKIFRMLREKTVYEVLSMYSDTNHLSSNKMTSEIEDAINLTAVAAEERLKAMRAATHVINNCRKNEWEIYEIQEVAKKIEQNINADVNNINFDDVSTDDLKELIKDEKEG